MAVVAIPSEFSLFPFWFWNDVLEEREILRQIADFEAHGVHAFVIHPRVGLPRDTGFMSEKLLGFMSIAIEEAARRGMKILLYDEGMYPSGSASGLVVASDPNLACRALCLHDAANPFAHGNVIARFERSDGRAYVLVDRKIDSAIRGLHYGDEAAGERSEDAPPAGDILNPATAATVLKLVHEKLFSAFGPHFGKTILGIFTDEPSAMGRSREKDARPFTTGLLPWVSERLGYDFAPHLPSLFFDDAADALKQRAQYQWAINRRLDESWYGPLSEWCAAHGVALCGHPDRGDEIGVQRFFQTPGQDLVWRWVMPASGARKALPAQRPREPEGRASPVDSSLEGAESTQAKGSSSAMIHGRKRRNSNEFCGAYGHDTSFAEFKWLADWCLIRGVNLLIPHAFYYSIRGPRRDERPPQVGGVGCSWWHQFEPFARHCQRLCALNTDCTHVCDIAILSPEDHTPWPAAKMLFQNQRDFNYLDVATFEREASIDASGVHVAGMTYKAVILDGDVKLTAGQRDKLRAVGDRVIEFDENLLAHLRPLTEPDVALSAEASGLRVRHIVKDGTHWYQFFQEIDEPLSAAVKLGTRFRAAHWIDSTSGEATAAGAEIELRLDGFGTALLRLG